MNDSTSSFGSLLTSQISSHLPGHYFDASSKSSQSKDDHRYESKLPSCTVSFTYYDCGCTRSSDILHAPPIRCENHTDNFITQESYSAEVDRFKFLVSAFELRIKRLRRKEGDKDDYHGSKDAARLLIGAKEDLQELNTRLEGLTSEFERESLKKGIDIEDENSRKYEGLEKLGICLDEKGEVAFMHDWTRESSVERLSKRNHSKKNSKDQSAGMDTNSFPLKSPSKAQGYSTEKPRPPTVHGTVGTRLSRG